MGEKIKQWLTMLGGQWWNVFPVYVSVLIAVYLAIWTLIEPINIPEQIVFGKNVLERIIFHLDLSFLITPHFVIVLIIMLKYWSVSKTKTIQHVREPVSPTNIPTHPKHIIPTAQELFVFKVNMIDKKISEEIFINLVLLSVNGKTVDENFANEMLRKTGYKITKLDSIVFTIAKK